MISNRISSRLNEALRFSGNPIESPETVAQHVAAMSLLGIEFYNIILNEIPDAKFDIRDLCYRITIHDLDEAAMGDIPRPIKYYDSMLLAEFNRVSEEQLKFNYNIKIYHDVINSKDDSFYGLITSILDSLQCILRLKISVGFSKRYTKSLTDSVDVLNKKIDSIDYSSYTEDEVKMLKIIVRETLDELQHCEET